MAIIKPVVRTWDLKIAGTTDSALAGRQPLLETVMRAADLESAYLHKEYAVAIYWDAAKFFDSLDLPTLIDLNTGLTSPSCTQGV